MKTIILIAAIALTINAHAQLYKSIDKGVNVSFFSKTPLENIDAKSIASTSIINDNNDSVFFKIPIKAFQFKNSLMGEHFNENYLESEKHPYASLRAKINGDFNLAVDGVYKVKATGKLLIHGVEVVRNFDGDLKVSNGTITLSSAFKVKLVDHEIDVPKVVTAKIAEIIEVEINANYVAFKK